MFIIQTTDFSFPGTTEDEKTTVSHLIISIELCFQSDIRDKAENSSH
ncbi:MAG: hypothetical protein LBU14_02785 [Candidatus Peribacteria bacterium]|nr:hypothetical protein [Candidatus Peribacteria bacterium]